MPTPAPKANRVGYCRVECQCMRRKNASTRVFHACDRILFWNKIHPGYKSYAHNPERLLLEDQLKLHVFHQKPNSPVGLVLRLVSTKMVVRARTCRTAEFKVFNTST
jgi:hypothetical protein